MSFDSAFEMFGVPGLILFGVGVIAYKVHQHYRFSIASYDFLNNHNAHKTLWELWENGENAKTQNWNHYYYAKKIIENNKPIWKINLPAVENGDIYLYKGLSELPSGLEEGKYFFRIKIKNLNPNIEVFFEKKCFYGTRDQHILSKYKPSDKQEIICDGVHYWEPRCYIGQEEGDGEEKFTITKEQIGIYIKALNDCSIENLIIEEAYIGKKCYKINLFPYISNNYYLVVEPKLVPSE